MGVEYRAERAVGGEEGAICDQGRHAFPWCVPSAHTLASTASSHPPEWELCIMLTPDASHEAHKRYEKSIRTTKADLVGYERQKEAALGLAPGTLVPANATNESLIASGSSSKAALRGLTAAEDLYRGADTLSYGDSKPSEDAVDRVVGKINQECVKSAAKRQDDNAHAQPWQDEEEEEGRLRRDGHVYQREEQGVQQEGELIVPGQGCVCRDRNADLQIARYFDKYTKEYVAVIFTLRPSTDQQDPRELRKRDGFITPIVLWERSLRRVMYPCHVCLRTSV